MSIDSGCRVSTKKFHCVQYEACLPSALCWISYAGENARGRGARLMDFYWTRIATTSYFQPMGICFSSSYRHQYSTEQNDWLHASYFSENSAARTSAWIQRVDPLLPI